MIIFVWLSTTRLLHPLLPPSTPFLHSKGRIFACSGYSLHSKERLSACPGYSFHALPSRKERLAALVNTKTMVKTGPCKARPLGMLLAGLLL